MDFVLELAKLIKQTPKHCLPSQDNENSPYISFVYKSKDCYLCYASSYLYSCYYADTCNNDRDCVDVDYAAGSELCYECVDIAKSYNCDFCQDSVNCTDCAFCYDCHACNNCFGCVGLQKKEFYIFNEKYDKKTYTEKLSEYKKLLREEIYKKVENLRLKYPHRHMFSLNNENVFGNYVKNSKNCFFCFNAENVQDSGYLCDEIINLKDCYDCDHVTNSELCYNSMSVDLCYNLNGSFWMVNCRDCDYGFCNNGCSNCFGCVNVRRKEYCILNQQYDKETYFKKIAKIKAELIRKNQRNKYLVADAAELAKTL